MKQITGKEVAIAAVVVTGIAYGANKLGLTQTNPFDFAKRQLRNTSDMVKSGYNRVVAAVKPS